MTINERAKEFAQENSKGYNPHLVAHAYHCGAVDQQNIDIEKACEWLKAYADCYIQEYYADGLTLDHEIDESLYEDFREAMKGE